MGTLLIVATATGVIAGGLLDSVVSGGEYLAKISGHQDRVLAGVFLQVMAAFACAGIGVALYPVIRHHDAGVALGAAAFRIIEAAMYIVGAIGTLVLIELAQEHARAATPSDPYFQNTGALVHGLRDGAAVTGILAFYLGAALYYSAFHRSRMIPRWLSDWGIVGVALGAAAALCVLFDLTEMRSTLQMGLNVPIGVQEMVLAVWLIARGFEPAHPAGEHRKARVPPRWFVVGFWRVHRMIYRATAGRVGLWRARPHRWGALSLTTIGRRSGRRRGVILGYVEDGDNLVVLAMNGWAAPEPAWWLNLKAHPDAHVEISGGRRDVHARAAVGKERERLWRRWREIDKNLDGYASRRTAETAVVILEPRAGTGTRVRDKPYTP